MSNLPESDTERLADPSREVKGYRVDTDEASKHMRIVFFGEHGQKRVIGYLMLDSSDGYEFAAALLKNYDRLEGIK